MVNETIVLQVCEFTGQYDYQQVGDTVTWVLDDGSSISIDFYQMITTMLNWLVYDKTFYSLIGLSNMSGIVVDLE